MTDRPLGSRYTIGEVLGQGGMGQVFHGRDDAGAEYAVKILRPDLAGDHVVVTRFVQERSILLEVTHPNLVRMHDLVVEGQTLAIVMDLVRGPDLRTALRSVGACPPAEVARLCGQVARALAAVHAARVVHRDVKPENVLLDRATDPPYVRLSDFGISRLITGSETARTTVLMGTPLYMAPELTAGDDASPASDLYALGIMAYELSCGISPFAAATITGVIHGHTHVSPGRPAGIVDPLCDLIARLLAKDPAARPQAAATVAASFEHLAGSLRGLPAAPVIATPPRGVPVPPPHVRRPQPDTVITPINTPPALLPEPTPLPPHRRKSRALAAWAGAATALVVCLGVVVALAVREGAGSIDTDRSAFTAPTSTPSSSPTSPSQVLSDVGSRPITTEARPTTVLPQHGIPVSDPARDGPGSNPVPREPDPNVGPNQCAPLREAPTNQTLLTTKLRNQCREDVRLVQRWLISCGYLEPGYDDGKYGPITDAAVTRFQREYNLDVEPGVRAGPKTWRALQVAAEQCNDR